MSLDHVQREEVLRATRSRVTKLVQHSGNALIALDLTTPQGMKRFIMTNAEAEQFLANLRDALESEGLNPLT